MQEGSGEKANMEKLDRELRLPGNMTRSHLQTMMGEATE